MVTPYLGAAVGWDAMQRWFTEAGKTLAGEVAVALHTLLGSRARGGVGILMYHRVAPRPGPGVPRPTWNVTPERFRAQVEGLLAAGYRVWSLRRLLDASARGEAFPPRVAVLTFDDGYAGVFLHAWPVLRELGVPATVFVASAFLDGDRPFPFDPWGLRHRERVPPDAWRPLRWAECREMEGSGLVEVGSHTHTHRDFRGRPAEFLRDLRASLAVLADRLGPRPGLPAFAFPFGGRRHGFSGGSLAEAAREAGVACGLTTEIGLVRPGSSPFEWGRLEVVATDRADSLVAKLEGWVDWLGPLRAAFQGIAGPDLPGVEDGGDDGGARRHG